MATATHLNGHRLRENHGDADQEQVPEIKIYSHSPLVYWWPVWVVGYVMALLTALGGVEIAIGDDRYLVHPSKNVGVIYTVVFMLTILFTNVSLRGLASVLTIVSTILVTVLFAWLDWWEVLLGLLPQIGIHVNLGFYVFFSTAMLIIWLLAFFVFDRLSFWRIRPGQMTFERVVGGGEKSYDTQGLVFEKKLEDFFKHHILGLGMGDLRITTTGARAEDLYIPNVAFVDRKVRRIQRLIAIKPDEAYERVVTAGEPG